MKIDKHGVDNLVGAIARQAVSDWRNSMRRLKRSPNNVDANAMVIDCELFFLSGYFTLLTDMDGKAFLKKLYEKHGYEFPYDKYPYDD